MVRINRKAADAGVIVSKEPLADGETDEEGERPVERTARTLTCLLSGHTFADDGLRNEEAGYASLLRADYERKLFAPRAQEPGLYRYADWLPIDRALRGSAAPLSYFSQALAQRLQLPRLLITFSGYWPQRGALMKTGSFKECEAYSVCARFPAKAGRLVVASAGNTAKAFLRAASENGVPLVLVIPEKNLKSLFAVDDVADCVRVVAAGGGSDYTDAIALAARICQRPGFVNEGGAKNVARRDGMGTTVLSAAELAGEVPAWYCQAIGSGTGAIAAHEAALRLQQAGLSGGGMRLLLAQNAPFQPIADAWAKRERALAPMDEETAKRQIDAIDAKVLSNRTPPYGIAGGLFDALSAAGGEVLAATNAEIRAAMTLFDQLEGCDICPEAGAALTVLMKAAQAGLIGRDELVMLNVTGGGMRNIQRELAPRLIPADIVADPSALAREGEAYVDALCVRLQSDK